ncbi:MAG: hypothetical protein H8D96_20790 [Desulfobacterales bacterium]|uniref:Uncharacterized protein n=1 Tax=Candidatus Desulfatibia vada TaxID=2841696 RepID=A0A8J6NX18_9BACT|nr:hypothetical protein [Candidatus Desulfatibia vada]
MRTGNRFIDGGSTDNTRSLQNAVGKRGVSLDPTHEHSFIREGFRNFIQILGGFEIIKLKSVIPNWFFIYVGRKK